MIKNKLLLLILIPLYTQTLEIIQKPSQNFNERIDKKKRTKVTKPTHLILHYTTDCFHKKSYRALSNFFRRVSAHYLIAADGKIFQLVDESKRAWHAGNSSWRDNNQMNTYSIGIEIVNPGFSKTNKNPCTINQDIWNQSTAVQVAGSSYYWYHFTPEQVDSVIKLCKDIMQRYDIAPELVLGHSDIAPGRKVDPGPLFPWQKLAQKGVGVWHAAADEVTELPPLKEIQQMLRSWGYHVKPSGKMNNSTKKAIKAFQMHFRPDNINGILDTETVSILKTLCHIYV